MDFMNMYKGMSELTYAQMTAETQNNMVRSTQYINELRFIKDMNPDADFDELARLHSETFGKRKGA